MGWRSCVSCCGEVKDGQGDEVPIDPAEEMDEQFIFVEHFPTDKRVEQPAVPFIGELPVPIEVGRVIELVGEVLPNATRFSVNLVCGTSSHSDIAFHLNPRFDQNHVVRNSRLSERWGLEECTAVQRNPLKRGKKFHVIILAAEEKFMVAINGIHFCSYTYRTMRIKIQTVQIHGDVVIDSLDYRMTDRYPEIPPNSSDVAVPIEPGKPLSDSVTGKVELPLVCHLIKGFTVGRQIEIVGRTKLLPHSFYVNLQAGEYLWPHPDILLHINPRFASAKLGHWVILNSWVKGDWSHEEKTPLLFTPGRPFTLKIICRPGEYFVTVDGATLGPYRHRSPPDLVNTMYIQGDVLIKEVIMS